MQAILTDIEGTTSSISFVHQVLFPYAARELPAFVRAHGHEPEVRRWLDAAALDIGGVVADECIVEILQGWIREDRKHPALKALQGMLWKDGYLRGDFKGHIYPDAAQALQRWHDAGLRLYVYSSGSVAAQQLLFGHSEAGDLRGLFSGWFDTAVGGKREQASYHNIVEQIGLPAGQLLFLSDVVEELDAARQAGLDTVLLDRPQDYPAPRDESAAHGHPSVASFSAIDVPLDA